MVTSRIWFTAAQKAELWERWKNGQSAAAISRALERKNKTGVERIVVLHGGIGPAPRRRALAALRFEEREEISRGISGSNWTGAPLDPTAVSASRESRLLRRPNDGRPILILVGRIGPVSASPTAVSTSRESRLRRSPLHEIEMQGAFVVAMRTTARPAGTRIDGVQSSRGSFLGVQLIGPRSR